MPKKLYGEKKVFRVANINTDTNYKPIRFKEVRKYSFFERCMAIKHLPGTMQMLMAIDEGLNSEERPVEWIKETKCSIIFENGTIINNSFFDTDVNIRPGDLFDVFLVNGNITFAKSTVNGLVVYDEPIVDQPNELYKRLWWKRKLADIDNVKNYLIASLKFLYNENKKKLSINTQQKRPFSKRHSSR
ncbi:MAG: hypothetical protein K9L17_00015 [Clostridiales bacterium]|nr:hypothetical protein [Clostridiales bacterium]MCF8021076.1 hypothetical protein [Clostridiales bacterium]